MQYWKMAGMYIRNLDWTLPHQYMNSFISTNLVFSNFLDSTPDRVTSMVNDVSVTFSLRKLMFSLPISDNDKGIH